ncbi:GtrA family protein [Vibrio kyushuensis]|uniref:GtrA family protein n=1 Tax=Vibrio kyushuensis TaxID=2910249 RepID=UPI003D0E6DF7
MKLLGLYVFFQGLVYVLELSLFVFMTQVLALNVIESNAFCKVVASVTSFYMHKYCTFKQSQMTGGNTGSQAVKYFSIVIINTVITSLMLWFLYDVMGLFALFSKFISDVIVILISFYLTKKIVFGT